MKKILVTTLALSLAAVSTVDAKSRGRSMATPVTREEIKNAKTPDAAEELIAKLLQNPDVVKLADLELQKRGIVARLAQLNEDHKELRKKGSWVPFLNSEQHKKDLSDINEKISKEKKDLKEIEDKMKAEDKELSNKEDSYLTRRTIGAAVGILGLAAAAEYWYSGEAGYVGAGMKYLGETRIGETAGKVKGAIGETAGKVRGAIGETWKKYGPERLTGAATE